MSKVKRYDFVGSCRRGPTPDGYFVRFSDYAKLEAELHSERIQSDRLLACHAQQSEILAALTAERDRLKEALEYIRDGSVALHLAQAYAAASLSEAATLAAHGASQQEPYKCPVCDSINGECCSAIDGNGPSRGDRNAELVEALEAIRSMPIGKNYNCNDDGDFVRWAKSWAKSALADRGKPCECARFNGTLEYKCDRCKEKEGNLS